jgi:hypothetical protein
MFEHFLEEPAASSFSEEVCGVGCVDFMRFFSCALLLSMEVDLY